MSKKLPKTLEDELKKIRANKEKTMKWYLINEDDFKKVQAALGHAIELQKKHCDLTNCMCGVDTPNECYVFFEEALHDLNTGLNSTDCMPSDFTD